ncbi:MAG: aminodeoxychorismate synthase component I [Candidatus Hydrogenedentes bacterium]|nr:aminodeoxychorismate synthase component I [Candidatus Hydrogenedentota bacterium]
MPSPNPTPEVHAPPPFFSPAHGPGLGDVTFVSREGARSYASPVEIISVSALEDVRPALERVNRCVEAGLHAAGFLSYEAAPAFDSAMKTHPPGPVPLLCFGIFEKFTKHPQTKVPIAPHNSISWEPLVGREEYGIAMGRIRQWLAAGDTYQVNYTFSMRAAVHGDPFELFARLCASQPADFSAYVDAGRFKILSLSPELFFRLDGDRIITRPMKGTASRGLGYDDDCARARLLQRSAKERAENVMIVDLLRNDLGRISRTGSVTVDSLFDAERYDTLWQMTSSISSKTEASLPDIFAALFPSGSVTGAPKLRTMEIIRELEQGPRGVYCGAVGWMAPDRQAEFNVAIRTMTVDTNSCEATYPVGSGITWDSLPQAEYDECLLKASVLNHYRPDFELLESILWDSGYFLLEEHLRRLSQSACYFGIALDLDLVRRRLAETARTLSNGPHKMRLRIARSGSISIDRARVLPPRQLKVGLALKPVDSSDVFLYHKTTHRRQYESLKLARPELDDVLLWNERGEVTESTIANVVVKRAGSWITPPVSCGLLPGVMREHLLLAGEIREAVIRKEDLARAQSVALINSVRKWIEVSFTDLAAV